MLKIPESELKFSFSRSSGAGGQNVNKVETKVTARWDFQKSPFITNEQKEQIEKKLKNRLHKNGELAVSSQSERSQNQNLKSAVEILNRLAEAALKVVPKRKKTKVSRSAKERRLQNKKMKSEKKSLRKKFVY